MAASFGKRGSARAGDGRRRGAQRQLHSLEERIARRPSASALRRLESLSPRRERRSDGSTATRERVRQAAAGTRCTSSLIAVAPWLPPMTSKTGRAGSRPRAARQCRGIGGLKLRPHRRAGDRHPAIVQDDRRRTGSRRRPGARPTTASGWRGPGMVLDSCRNVRAPDLLAARIGEALVKPPIASAACGGRAWKSFLAARKERMNPRTKASSPPRVRPTAGRTQISMPETRLHGVLVHFLGRDGKHHQAAAPHQGFGHRQPGKEMPARAAASDGDPRCGLSCGRHSRLQAEVEAAGATADTAPVELAFRSSPSVPDFTFRP